MVIMHTNDYGERMPIMSDTQWYAEERAQMKWAFSPVSPALVTMFWVNQHLKQSLCIHKWQCSEDGYTCVKCSLTRMPWE